MSLGGLDSLCRRATAAEAGEAASFPQPELGVRGRDGQEGGTDRRERIKTQDGRRAAGRRRTRCDLDCFIAHHGAHNLCALHIWLELAPDIPCNLA